MALNSKQIIYIFFTILVLSSFSYAQESITDDDNIENYPWESYSDYAYFEEASHFWNLNYRPGTGIFSFTPLEYLEFETNLEFLDYFNSYDAPVFLEQDVRIQDYWSSISFGGVIHKYFFFKVEGGMANKSETLYKLDVDGNRISSVHYENYYDITFQTELRFGFPLNNDFTMVGLTSFRVWSSKIENYKTHKEYNDGSTTELLIDLDTEIYVFNSQIMLYFELMEFDKDTSLNLFTGMGYIKYKALEKYNDDSELIYNNSYYPDTSDNAEFIAGATLILSNQFMIELKIIPIGVFRAQLVFSYLV